MVAARKGKYAELGFVVVVGAAALLAAKGEGERGERLSLMT